MRINLTRWIIAAIAVTTLLANGSPRVRQRAPWPFTPEVEEFIETYVKVGGDKLTNWHSFPTRRSSDLKSVV